MSKWEFINKIAEGTYGVVAKCRHRENGEIVAIKKFKEKEQDLDEDVRKVVLREIKLLKALKHENVIELKEAFRRKGTLHIVFELFGTSLLDVIDANPQGLEEDKVQLIICQVTRALAYCHRRGVIHRDMKPENVLVDTSDYAVRLCDFGCARPVPEAGSILTEYVATRWYRPPELLLSYQEYSTPVDMWALGCIAGELTDGQALFPGESDIDQLAVIQRVLGPLSADQQQKRLEMSSLQGVRFPDVVAPKTLERHYGTKMSPNMAEFMHGLLQMEPSDRLSAKAVLKLAWMEGLALPESLKEVKEARNAAAVAQQAAKASSKQAKEKGQAQSTGGGLQQGSLHHMDASATPPDEREPRQGREGRRLSQDSVMSQQITPRKQHSRESPRPPLPTGLSTHSTAAHSNAGSGAGLPPIGSSSGLGGPRKQKYGSESAGLPPAPGSRGGVREETPESNTFQHTFSRSNMRNNTSSGNNNPNNSNAFARDIGGSPELVAPEFPGESGTGFFRVSKGSSGFGRGGTTAIEKGTLSGTGRFLLRADSGSGTEGLGGAQRAGAVGVDGATRLRLGGNGSRWTGA